MRGSKKRKEEVRPNGKEEEGPLEIHLKSI